MTSRSGAKGYRFEAAFVEWLKAHGFPKAERRAKRGIHDAGDVGGVEGIVAELKNCRRWELSAWMKEAEIELRNDPGAELAIVVVKRPTVADPGRSYVVLEANAFFALWWSFLRLRSKGKR